MNKQFIREFSGLVFFGLLGVVMFTVVYAALCVWAKVASDTMTNGSYLPVMLGFFGGMYASTYIIKDKTNVS